MKRPTRKELREALETVPVDQILGVPGELTHKQREFARLVASGEKGAVAYRSVYNATGKKKTHGDNASRIKADSRVRAEIEAYRLANEAAKHRTPQQLRELVIHSLVQVVIDPDANHAQRVQAAKVLGTVTEVAAFTERREVTHVKSADDAKRAVLEKLRELMRADATDAESRDIVALERELSTTPDPVLEADAATQDDPTPQNAVRSPTSTMHSIPHTQSFSDSSQHTQSFSDSNPPPPATVATDDLEAELAKAPRHVSGQKDPGGIS